jgi:hypothetical protein
VAVHVHGRVVFVRHTGRAFKDTQVGAVFQRQYRMLSSFAGLAWLVIRTSNLHLAHNLLALDMVVHRMSTSPHVHSYRWKRGKFDCSTRLLALWAVVRLYNPSKEADASDAMFGHLGCI